MYVESGKMVLMNLFAEMWMDLEPNIQSEVSQKEKNKHCI